MASHPKGNTNVIIKLGFTEPRGSDGYLSFSDGYRIGAPQLSVTITLDGDGSRWDAQQWAEAAFTATNIHEPAGDPAVAAIQHAIAEQVHTPLRSLSVGDTVTVHGQMWACDRAGWHRVDDTPPPS
jgi:hypothetical protein